MKYANSDIDIGVPKRRLKFRCISIMDSHFRVRYHIETHYMIEDFFSEFKNWSAENSVYTGSGALEGGFRNDHETLPQQITLDQERFALRKHMRCQL